VIHVRLPYRITLTLGILALATAVAGCGGDASQSDVDVLRKEVADLKAAQAQMQTTLAALEARPGAAAPAEEPPAEPANFLPKREAVRRIPLDYTPRKGPEVAAVTVVEFADFQCPFCKANAGLSDQLLKEFPNDVRFAFKHFPLGKHPQAQAAARAAWAAQQQDKFWEMHDLIYAGDIQQLSPDVLRGYAEKIGLDMDKYTVDVESSQSAAAVSFDKMLGKSFKVGGTPVYYVNGKRVRDPSAAAVRAKVQAELDAFRGTSAAPSPAP
jgi:protein-disulfide isomerase